MLRNTNWAANPAAQGTRTFTTVLLWNTPAWPFIRTHNPTYKCKHRHTHTVGCSVSGETRWLTADFGLPGSTMLLFSFLAWGELAQVELTDFKVAEWLAGLGGGGLSWREMSLLMGDMVCVGSNTAPGIPHPSPSTLNPLLWGSVAAEPAQSICTATG